MLKKKIAGAMESAVGYLESAINALKNKNEKELAGFVWQAAAELEYASFLFSVERENEIGRSSWKHGSSSKKLEIKPALIKTLDIVKEAKIGLDANKLSEAYQKTWKARGNLFSIQKTLKRKHKSKSEK